MKSNKIKKIVYTCMIICGIAMTVLFAILANGYKRPYETYYHHSEGSFSYGYIEIRTTKKIDVDNCYVYLETPYKIEKERLDYKGYNNYYKFKYYLHDYIFQDVEIYDESGSKIELTKFSEIEELQRKKPVSIMICLSVLSSIITLISVSLLLHSLGLKLSKMFQVSEAEKNMFTNTINIIEQSTNKSSDDNKSKEKRILCKYCGSDNHINSLKCSNCGANLNNKNNENKKD